MTANLLSRLRSGAPVPLNGTRRSLGASIYCATYQVLRILAGRSAHRFRSFHWMYVRIKSRRWQAMAFPKAERLSVAATAVLNSLQVKNTAQPAIRRNEIREHRVRRSVE